MAFNRFIIEGASEDLNPFDRQEMISWWDQEALRSAKVLVVGAGAIGNEAIKNLALLGVGYILITDLDSISASNLSRTVLFRRNDIGKNKAEVAAARALELRLEDTATVDWLNCDVVWDLGTGVFREVDVVLGCVDNIEARLAINQQCWLARTPWIDAGINELAGHVSVYKPGETPCYLCTATKAQLSKGRERYSCDDFKRRAYSQHRVATVQLSSAVAAALQVQEAVKLLCGKHSAAGHRIIFQGTTNEFDSLRLQEREDCPAHIFYPAVEQLTLSRSCTLRDFLLEVSQKNRAGEKATLDIGHDIAFVQEARCRACNEFMELNAPAFRVYDDDVICDLCRENQRLPLHWGTERKTLTSFCLESTPSQILDLKLEDLGIPFCHIMSVQAADGTRIYYELGGDMHKVFPSLCERD